jgi:hypothetical protein
MNRRRFIATLAALPAAALAVATQPEPDPLLDELSEVVQRMAETDRIYRQAMLDADRLTGQLREFTWAPDFVGIAS